MALEMAMAWPSDGPGLFRKSLIQVLLRRALSAFRGRAGGCAALPVSAAGWARSHSSWRRYWSRKRMARRPSRRFSTRTVEPRKPIQMSARWIPYSLPSN